MVEQLYNKYYQESLKGWQPLFVEPEEYDWVWDHLDGKLFGCTVAVEVEPPLKVGLRDIFKWLANDGGVALSIPFILRDGTVVSVEVGW